MSAAKKHFGPKHKRYPVDTGFIIIFNVQNVKNNNNNCIG
jgi:hypothetical protein